MKSATLPPLRVTPELRQAAENVLEAGESLSSFVETSVRKQIESRNIHKVFISRGLAAREDARRTGVYYDADTVHAELRGMLAEAEAKAKTKA